MSVSVVVPSLNPEKAMTPEFLRSYAIEVIFSQSKGIGKARNDGAKIIKGDILIFIDDDASLDIETFKSALKMLYEKPKSIICTKHPILCSRFMVLSKDVFFDIGGFDETFKRCEDLDFGYRAIRKGYAIRYIPFNKVKHRDHSGAPPAIKLLREASYKTRLMVRYKEVLFQKKGNYGSWKINLKNVILFFIGVKGPRVIWNLISLSLKITSFYYYLFFDKSKIL